MDDNSKTVYLSNEAVQHIRERYYAKYHAKHVKQNWGIYFRMFMLLTLVVVLVGLILSADLVTVENFNAVIQFMMLTH